MEPGGNRNSDNVRYLLYQAQQDHWAKRITHDEHDRLSRVLGTELVGLQDSEHRAWVSQLGSSAAPPLGDMLDSALTILEVIQDGVTGCMVEGLLWALGLVPVIGDLLDELKAILGEGIADATSWLCDRLDIRDACGIRRASRFVFLFAGLLGLKWVGDPPPMIDPSKKGRFSPLKPDAKNATGAHSTWRTGADGSVTHHAEWAPNPQNPSGFDQVKRVDLQGDPHFNKVTGQDVPTPHTQGKDIPGGVRPARPDEIPGGRS
jgi:hypothetical protein